MAKKTWVIRIVQLAEYTNPIDKLMASPLTDSWIECLRYAGVVHVVETASENTVFDILPPANIRDSKVWAESNAGRIKSFGMNAAAAPRTW